MQLFKIRKDILVLYANITDKAYEPFWRRWLNSLPDYHKNRCMKFKFERDKKLYIISRIMTVYGLNNTGSSNIALNSIRENEYGKPELCDIGLYFNWSHSYNCAVSGIWEQESIGIDIERIKKVNLSDFKDCFNNIEWDGIFNHRDRIRGFFKYWCAKESVLKANGKGFNIPLSNVTVNLSEGSAELEGRRYYFAPIEISKKYMCYMASSKLPGTYQLIDFIEHAK